MQPDFHSVHIVESGFIEGKFVSLLGLGCVPSDAPFFCLYVSPESFMPKDALPRLPARVAKI
jgi:hypothetical protein